MHIKVGDYCVVSRLDPTEDEMVQVTKAEEYTNALGTTYTVYVAEFSYGAREFGEHHIIQKYAGNFWDELLFKLVNI